MTPDMVIPERERFDEVTVEVIELENDDVVTTSNLLIPDEEETR